MHAVTDWASAALDWQLFLPRSWDETTVTDAEIAAEIVRRRARCKIPDHVRHREKWRLGLDMLDRILGAETDGGWGLSRFPCKPRVTDVVKLSQRESSGEENDERVQCGLPSMGSGS